MRATPKNLLALTRLEERLREVDENPELPCDRYVGRPVLTPYDLWPGERYHAERLVRLGFLRKVRAAAPWHGPAPITMYYLDEGCTPNPFPYRHVRNRAMRERLAGDGCYDVSYCPRSWDGDYLIGTIPPEELAGAASEHEVARLAEYHTAFRTGHDLCDAQGERWIWSVGVHRETGRVWVSTSSNLYGNPAFICIWLR